MWQVDWGSLAAGCAVAGAIGGTMLMVLRAKFSHFFVTRPEWVDMEHRFTDVEQRLMHAEQTLSTAPNHSDIRAILDRLAEGAGRFGVLAAQMEGVRQSNVRVESQVDMLVRSMLERERGGPG